jgi:hypothetical protein
MLDKLASMYQFLFHYQCFHSRVHAEGIPKFLKDLKNGVFFSFLGDSNFYGRAGLNFYTQIRTVTQLWRSEDGDPEAKPQLAFPQLK